MADITKEQIIETLSSMTVMELNELRKALEDKWGVTAAVPMAMGPMAAAGAAPVEEAPTEFNVILTGFGDKKIQVIKEVRAITSLGLKEAKDLVEGVPKTVKESVSKEEAEKLKKQIEDAGGTIEVKPA